MSEMVERVAKALHASYLTDHDFADQTPWEGLEEYQREYGRKQARAAIAATTKEKLAEIDAQLTFAK